MAVISIPHNEPWLVGGPALRAVLDPLIAILPEGPDRDEVIEARELKALQFGFMPLDQRARIATALLGVAAELRVSLASEPDATEWDLGLAERLKTLEMLLHDLLE